MAKKYIKQCLYCGYMEKLKFPPNQIMKAVKHFNIIVCEDCKLKGKRKI